MKSGIFRHFVMTLRLNFRSPAAVAYGYLVPVIFLVAFGALFRSGTPRLTAEMGQLVTITILGGACFGLPTALVSERERGVWRRYRLLPAGMESLVISGMAARWVIVGVGVVLQIVLARILYGSSWPAHPIELVGIGTVVTFAFLGLGLVIATLADSTPAVQALGQAIFLPMIMIGGVGVPLSVLPVWAQRVAGFLPGRYAVEALNPCFGGDGKIGFDIAALLVTGIAGCAVGGKLFRWESGQRASGRQWGWALAAIVPWIVVGGAAWRTGRLELPPVVYTGPVSEQQIASISFDNLPDDAGWTAPIAGDSGPADPDERARYEAFTAKLVDWPPGRVEDAPQRVRNLLSVAALTDLAGEDQTNYPVGELESYVGRLIFQRLSADLPRQEAIQVVAEIILRPAEGEVLTSIPELGLDKELSESDVRQRVGIYARKYLGRWLGKLPQD